MQELTVLRSHIRIESSSSSSSTTFSDLHVLLYTGGHSIAGTCRTYNRALLVNKFTAHRGLRIINLLQTALNHGKVGLSISTAVGIRRNFGIAL